MSYDAMSTVEARGHRSMGGRAHLPGNFFNFQVVAGPRCGDVRRSEVTLHMATCDVQSFNGDVRCSEHFLQMATCASHFPSPRGSLKIIVYTRVLW